MTGTAAKSASVFLGTTLTALALAASLAHAQDANRAVIGRITSSDGTPLGDVTVRVTRDSVTRIAYTDGNGRYRITGLFDGRWTLSAQRIGYTPFVTGIEVTLDGVERNIVLEPRPRTIDSVLVTARWTGVRGIVWDARSFTPLPDARVRIVGTDSADVSDQDGRFAIEMPRGKTVLVRIERDGFLPVMRSAAIENGRYVELDVPLDTALRAPRDYSEMKDLELRQRFAGAFSAMIPREELQQFDAPTLLDALRTSPSMRRKGMDFMRPIVRFCLFVNGRAQPGYPLYALRVEDIEFVEVFPASAEHSKTLERRSSECAPRRGAQLRAQESYWVSVWLRSR